MGDEVTGDWRRWIRQDVSEVRPLGGYAAKRCPVRTQLDVLRPVEPAGVSEFMRGLADAGNAFEAEVFDGLAGVHGLDLADAPADRAEVEVATLEEHLVTITAQIEDFRPTRVAVDSLSALERVGTVVGFRKFIVSLSASFKDRGLTALMTSTTPTFLGGASHSESHLSTVTDLIILLRHAEVAGAMQRGLVVLKMRGSRHDKDIRGFTVDAKGMHVGAVSTAPFELSEELARPKPIGGEDHEPDTG